MPEVDGITVRGRWYRHVPAGVDPLALLPVAADGRWQRGDVVAATYLADEPGTAWAKWYRALAEAALPPRRSLPRDLWAVEVAVEVADLSTAARLKRIGLRLPTPGRGSWPDFQAIGEGLHAAGWLGVLAPSASRPGHRALCLFRPSPQHQGITAIPPPQHFDEPPTPPRGMTT